MARKRESENDLRAGNRLTILAARTLEQKEPIVPVQIERIELPAAKLLRGAVQAEQPLARLRLRVQAVPLLLAIYPPIVVGKQGGGYELVAHRELTLAACRALPPDYQVPCIWLLPDSVDRDLIRWTADILPALVCRHLVGSDEQLLKRIVGSPTTGPLQFDLTSQSELAALLDRDTQTINRWQKPPGGKDRSAS
jgi:hypothetical protein